MLQWNKAGIEEKQEILNIAGTRKMEYAKKQASSKK